MLPKNYLFLNFLNRLLINKETTEIMLDAFGALETDLAQELLAEKILRSSTPNHKLIIRLMTHVAGMDRPPKTVNFQLNLENSSKIVKTKYIS